MNAKNDELKVALVDVRRAYRLLHAYHRRLQDLFQCVDDFLTAKGISFDSWNSINVVRLPAKSKPFFRNWAWDLTPAYQIACRWHGVRGRLTYQIEIEAFADTGYEQSGDGEPDPARFTSAETSNSEIRFGLWSTTAKTPDVGAAWTTIEKENWSDGNTHTATVDGAQYMYRYGAIDLVDLAHEHAVKKNLLEPLRAWIAGA